MGAWTRRRFLGASLQAGLALPILGLGRPGRTLRASRRSPLAPVLPDPPAGLRGDSSVAAALRSGRFSLQRPLPGLPSPVPDLASLALPDRFADLRRHFVFEYYPWYANHPYRHWNQWDRVPPDDIAATSVPALGPYDSRSLAVLEAHARWIADSGVGAINLSWWGRGSFEDQAVHTVMDVMRDHDVKVSFHLEPYAVDRSQFFAEDVLYLVREFGEKRGWDALLLLKDTAGREGPLFKSFRTVLPETYTDCHGITRRIPDYTPDGVWRRQTDRIRRALERDFHHVTLLSDSLDFGRSPETGFDGIAVYDNFVGPELYAFYAAQASRVNLLFSFNVNPGFDSIEPRVVEPGSCYEPRPFAPPTAPLDWTRPEDRERAAQKALERIEGSLAATITVQTDPNLVNAHEGFFLVYLTSFNEWHEGHAMEPMKDADALTEGERRFVYHNPSRGDYRLSRLTSLLEPVLAWATAPVLDRSA